MVKFKFPGKPSKIVSRSLVSAYSVVVPSCDTSSVSEDLCFGLSLFQSTFGDNDEGEPFNGFANEDIDEAKFKKRTHENYLRDKMISRGLCVPTIPLCKIDSTDNQIINVSGRRANSTQSKKCANECLTRPKERKKANKLWLHKRMLNRYHPKIQIRHNFKSLNKNSLMRFKHKTLSANYLSDRYCRKFILPSRSLHSSRVIKPNKRFIDHERNIKLKSAKESQTNQLGDDYFQDDVSPDSDVSFEQDRKRNKIETSSSKVIIREARLNITTETTITGPFSAKKFVDKESRSGVITCGICGSVRFYKYILQTRKFGIYSCEPCRRFILKMIKYSKQPHFDTLKCKADTGIGKCVILPVTSTRRKDSEDPFKNYRCNACLLSLCLQKYIMPASIKKSLIQLIPEEVKSNYLNGLSPPDLKKPLAILEHPLGGLCKPIPTDEGHDKSRKRLNMHNYLRNVRCTKRPIDKYDIRSNKSSSFLHKRNIHQRTNIKNKAPQENPKIKENFTEKDHYIPRGPRIKHVCRSASSVLRTSNNDREIEEPTCPLSDADCGKNSRKNSEPKVADKSNQLPKIRQCDDTIPVLEQASDTDSSKAIASHYGARTLQDFGKQSSDESDENEDKLISTDFWEAYDPDEVYKTGFPLISSESLNVRALCFLCGSAGIEKLLYCVSCCEPYHWYCAEGPSAFRDESELEKCRVNWVCRKCKVCSACGERDSRILTSCQRCKNSYHNECLTNKAQNKRLFKSDRPWVCPTCLKCKSCNSSSVFTYVGNIPLCSQCFKLRQKGSFCPLCQRCYQDDDYNVKMMECGICEKWIHAKCEGISHEKYQILSFLPDTIEFVCRLCCSLPPAQWWLAVEDELKAGYLGILKCLCKNKKVSDLFKESPRKGICRCATKFVKKPALGSDSEIDSDSCIDADSEAKTISGNESSSSFATADKYDSGVDDVKDSDCSGGSDEGVSDDSERCSFCRYNSETRNKINNDLLRIKAKVHNNQYSSLLSFHQELTGVIEEVEELDLIQSYRESLKKFFPWFDPDCPRNDDVHDVEMAEVCDNGQPTSDLVIEKAVAEEEFENLRRLMSADEFDYEKVKQLDLRKCNLCKGTGEAVPSEGGRLIYCGRNEWVHSNCALWSSEVFEEIDGSLQNVHSAISRGRQIRCAVCDKKGASVGCCFKNCIQTYHFQCAKKAECVFLQNRTIYCRSHDTNEIVLPVLTSEKDFEILRPVYIEMDRKKKKLECHSNVKMRVGSLHVENLGKIDPHLSDNPKYILPVYFRCTRLFWSTTKPWKIVQYHIQIKLRYCYQAAKSDSEANYTVDHSHNADRSSSQLSTTGADDEVVKQIVAEMVNKVASKEDYSYISSQSGGDLLSPELQEAIYKDLPNDLLNDKTLHDIWTNYEGGLNYPNEQTTDRNVIIGCKKMPSSRACNGGSRSGKDEKSKSAESTASKATKANESTESARRISDDTRCSKNTKYLRDKNIREGEAPKRTQTTGTETLAEGFYNELYKVKRKINFENPSSGLNTKKKHYDEAYIGDVAPIDFYHEAAERTFKPTYVQSYENILQLDGMVDISDEEPVKCIRCHRTYRTSISFERHLEVCNSDFNDYISSCESDTSSEEEKFTVKTSPPKETVYDVGQQKFMIAIEDQNQVQYGAANMCNMSHNAVYSFSSMQQNHIQGHMNVAPQATFVQKQESITVTQQQPAIHEALKFNVVDEEKIKHEVRADYGGAQYALNGIQADAQYQIQNVAPTYVIQSFPKQEVIPTYVAVDNTISECIQAQETLMQQPQLQLQPIATTVNQPQMNFQPVIPTILGTVMQPGVIETPTYIINAPNPNAELFAPQNNIILPNQPMLFGMETVVSNTVMSSSQFMTTESLGGNIGSSTMYQTTTTQVFQAAKQVPQNNFPSGFIVVNSPIQQATVPVQQPTQVPAAASEKYMYVQVNAENLANFKPPDKPKPVITKAVKNNVTAKDKPTKVMKVKNNKPVSVHAIPQVNLKTYQSDPVRVNGLQKPVNNCQIQGSTFPEPEHPAKPVMAANPIVSDRKRAPQSVPVAQVAPKMNSTMYAAPKPNTMLPVTQVARKPTPPVAQVAPKPNPILQKARYALPAALPKIPVVPEVKKVDKCVNTDVNKVPGVAVASTNTLSNERTIKISYTIDNDAKQNLNMANPIGKSWNLNIPVEKSCQTSTEPISSSKASVEVAPRVKPPLTCPPAEISNQSMPDLGFVSSPPSNNFPKPENTPKIEIKSESEKLFDELLRQHMLSMENSKSTSPDIEQTPVVESKPPENCPKPKLIPIPSKTKYKPQLNDVKRSTVPSEDASSKAYAKKKLLEKENLDKLTLVSEAENSKNWKTASISFEVNAEDGFTYKTNNLMDLWNKIIESVQTSRSKCKLPLLPKNAMVNGDSVYGLLGFENNASKYLLEQLPDAWKCIFYKPVFHKSPMQSSKSSPMKNESGCARTEPFNSSHKYDMFGWLASRHRKPPKFMMITDADIVNGNRRVTSLNLPMAMRFRHLKETAKETVGVFRSDIHGRGLFCLRDIDPGEMVIEYAGEVIRSTLTDKREKYYTSKGIGCYMFRIDDKYVVDATMCGNAARFINHSCEPNCYSRIVDILGKKHILIFALRKIPKGEELTYDYKFPLEDDKIYCHCLSRKCRKYLN